MSEHIWSEKKKKNSNQLNYSHQLYRFTKPVRSRKIVLLFGLGLVLVQAGPMNKMDFEPGGPDCLMLAEGSDSLQTGGKGYYPSQNRLMKGNRSGLEPGQMQERIFSALDLSDEQKKSLRKAHFESRKNQIKLRSERDLLELDLKEKLSNYPVDKPGVLTIADKIGVIEAKMSKFRVQSLLSLLETLTAEQHGEFVRLHEERKLKSMKNSKWKSKEKESDK